MNKRKRQDEQHKASQEPFAKRVRHLESNLFPDLSDELVLRILSYLPIIELVKVESVCQRFKQLASDNEIWREKFYLRFVRPRARRIPTVNAMDEQERESKALYYASKSARWLEHHQISHSSGSDDSASDWKRRYKIKLNWIEGRCKARDMVLDCPCKPRILVKICQGIVYTADENKLTAFSPRSRPQLLSTYRWSNNKRPTSMAVDTTGSTTCIVVGFGDGTVELLEVEDRKIVAKLQHIPKQDAECSSIAVSWPYILTLSGDKDLTLMEVKSWNISNALPSLDTLTSLQSDTMLRPVSLSIRRLPTTLIASIAYSFQRLHEGWCLGLQEVRLSSTGSVLNSRLTSSVGLKLSEYPFSKKAISSRSASTAPFALHPQLRHPPTSLSHSGCYILASLPDNTLMVYTVTSTEDKLIINGGRRLFGHTSSVAGAEVSDRGRALSISAKGDDTRVWDLETMLSSMTKQQPWTRLQPDYSVNDIAIPLSRRTSLLGCGIEERNREASWQRHWVGFDDEQVVVLGEQDQKQTLSCYDFA